MAGLFLGSLFYQGAAKSGSWRVDMLRRGKTRKKRKRKMKKPHSKSRLLRSATGQQDFTPETLKYRSRALENVR